MASEVSRIDGWIYAMLTADVGAGGINTLVNGRIYPYIASQGATYPLVIYSFEAGRDLPGLGTNRVMTRPVYVIKVISNGAPSAAARSAADRIDEVIGKAVASVRNGYVFSGRREQSIAFLEVDDNTKAQYWHVGGLYRIEAHPA